MTSSPQHPPTPSSTQDPARDARRLADLHTLVGRRLRRFGDRVDAASSVTRTAVDLVPRAEHAGLTLVRPARRLTTVGATSPLVDTIDAVQYELDTGPCVDAVVRERLTVSGDLPADERWPGFGARAAELGVLSMASYRLSLADQEGQDDVIGGLNLYAGQRDAFADDDVVAILVAVATYAALAVWSGGLTEEVASLRSALSGSREIGMAQGILLERFKVTPDEAFGLLAIASQNSNRKLREVAAELVETGEVPLPPTRRPRG